MKKELQKLSLKLTQKEGKKKQVDIAQMNEIVGHLADLLAQDPETFVLLCSIVAKRKKK